MKALLLIVLLTLAATGCGLSILRRMTIFKNALIERLCYALALGLGIAAYGVFVLGLLGFLKFVPITLWLTLIGLLGCLGWEHFLREIKSRKLPEGIVETIPNLWRWVFGVTALLCGVFAIAACFRPPTGTEWDALAYHLANPKVFLHDGRISILPTDHHSNFPFVMEMLFAVGLLYDGFALANLFHLVMAFGLIGATVAFSARLFGRNAGCAAGLLLMTTPLVLWEASVAYTDLGLALYASLATFAVISTANSRKKSQETQKENTGEIENPNAQYLLLAGLCAGFALGIKYLAILPLIVLVGYALIVRIPRKRVVQFALIAALVGSPWYIKNSVQMQNPVYPYLASVFSNSKYWSAYRAKTYEGEQKSFGFPNRLSADDKDKHTGKPLALVQTPWRVAANAELYANPGNYDYAEMLGGLVIGLCLCLVLMKNVPVAVRGIMGIALVQIAAWFLNAQVGRYLLSIFPLLCVGAGYAASVLSQKSKSAYWGVSALLLAQVGSLAYSVFTLPSHLSLGELSNILSTSDAATAYPRRRLGNFRACEWINTNTQATDGVILYEDVLGFYLDRPYLWGNGEHSSYIPYREMTSGMDLTRWLITHGYNYVMINLSFAKQAQEVQANGEPPPRPNGNELAYLQQWYVDNPAGMDTDNYRRLIQDAIKRGQWNPVFYQNGVVVLKIGREG